MKPYLLIASPMDLKGKPKKAPMNEQQDIPLTSRLVDHQLRFLTRPHTMKKPVKLKLANGNEVIGYVCALKEDVVVLEVNGVTNEICRHLINKIEKC